MKKLALLLSVVLFTGTLFGQNAYESKFNFDKKMSPFANGVGLKTQKPPEVMEETIIKKVTESAKKAKAKKVNKRMFVFESTVLPEVSPMTMDYYFRIEEVGKGNYVVQMFLSLGNLNFVSSAKFPNEIEAAKRFMNKLDDKAEMARLMAQIEKQEEKIEEQQKEYEKLIKSKEDLVKDHESLVKEIKQNEAEQEKVITKAQSSEEALQKLKEELKKLQAEMKKIR